MGPKRTFQHGGPTPPPLWAGRSPPRPARPGSGCPGRWWPRVRSGARDSEDLVRCGGRGRCCAAGPGELVRGAGRVGPTEPAAPRLRAGLELSSVPCPRRAGRYRPLPRSLPQRGVTSSALKIAPARAALGVGRGSGERRGRRCWRVSTFLFDIRGAALLVGWGSWSRVYLRVSGWRTSRSPSVPVFPV